MSFTLANPLLLPFLLAVGVPLLIHLFVRSRPPRYSFPSVEFLQKIVRRVMRVRKPRDWMLLALRTLLVLLVVFLFLQPLVFPKARLAALTNVRSVIILVDRSASMSYVEAGQTRFAAAGAEAAEVLSSLSSSDRANVIWVDNQPDAVFPELGSNHAYLRSELIRAAAGSEACQAEAALRLADEMLPSEGEVWIISDFQASDWAGVSGEFSRPHSIFTIPIGKEEASNLAVEAAETGPAYSIAGEEVELRCVIANHSKQSKSTTVYLNAGPIRQSKDVLIEPGTTATVTFLSTFDRPGEIPVRFSIDEDAFPGDNTRTALLTVQKFLSVAVGGEGESARIWRNVIAALPWAQLQPIDFAPEALPWPEGLQTVITTSWEGALDGRLKFFHENGGTIWWSMDPASQRQGAAWLKAPPETPLALEVTDESALPFRLFASGDYGDIAATAIDARLTNPPVQESSNVWLRYDDEARTPALWETPRTGDSGTLIGWNMPVTPEGSNWQSRIEFLPFVGEILLATRPTPVGRLWEFAPGDFVSLHSPTLPVDSRLVLAHANAEADSEPACGNSAELLGGGGVLFRADALLEPGVYVWEDEQKSLLGHAVVNFPPSESNLAPASTDQLATMTEGQLVAMTGGDEARTLEEGVPMWPWLLAAGAGLLLLTAMTEWLSDRVAEPAPGEEGA